jgi:hypothetical protein
VAYATADVGPFYVPMVKSATAHTIFLNLTDVNIVTVLWMNITQFLFYRLLIIKKGSFLFQSTLTSYRKKVILVAIARKEG